MSYLADYEFEEVSIDLAGAKIGDFFGVATVDLSEPDYPWIKEIQLYSKVCRTPDAFLRREDNALQTALFTALESALLPEITDYFVEARAQDYADRKLQEARDEIVVGPEWRS